MVLGERPKQNKEKKKKKRNSDGGVMVAVMVLGACLDCSVRCLGLLNLVILIVPVLIVPVVT